MLISTPTDRPPSSTIRVMGKAKPHTIATNRDDERGGGVRDWHG
jgi:hypothetical protein